MDFITIEESMQARLAYDKIGKEYFVKDKINGNIRWFSSLSQAKNFYNLYNVTH